MNETIMVEKLAAESYTSTFKLFMQYIDIRIDKLRVKNDTDSLDEVAKNQGAIKELISIRNTFTKKRAQHKKYDGAFV